MGSKSDLQNPLIAEAVRKGWITLPLIVGEGPPPRGKPVMRLREILLDLEQDRVGRDPTGRS